MGAPPVILNSHCLRPILSRGSSRIVRMASPDGLGSLTILNEDALRLILLDEALTDSLLFLASSSTQLLRHVLESGRAKKLTLYLRDMKLAAKWGEWLQQASGLHLHLDDDGSGDAVEDAAAIMALLLPAPTESQPSSNRGISALTVNLNVSVRMGWSRRGMEGLLLGTVTPLPFDQLLSKSDQSYDL